MRSWFNVFSLRSFKKLKWKNVFMFVMYINIYKWNERRRAHDISLNHSLYRRVMHNVLQHDLAVLRNGLKLLPCYYTHLIKFTCELVCFDIDVWKVIDMALNLKVVIRPNVVFFFRFIVQSCCLLEVIFCLRITHRVQPGSITHRIRCKIRPINDEM